MHTGNQAPRPATSTVDDGVLSVLCAQHIEIRVLLDEVGARAGVARQQAFDLLRELLAAHETAEQVVLWPAARGLTAAESAAAPGEEANQIAETLATLEKLDVDSAEFAVGLGRLADSLRAHAALQEAEEFPTLSTRLSPEQQDTLGRWTSRALELGPSRPQPILTDPPVAQWTVGPFAALVDHARDRFAQAREESAQPEAARR